MAKTAANNKKAEGVTVDKKTLDELEKAKKIFAEANKKYQEQRTKVTKAKRTIATGNKKLATLDKKIEETKDAPAKAAENLKKKAEDMIAKAKALEAEQKTVLDQAAEIDKAVEEKQKVLETAEAEAKAKLEEMGISPAATRRATASGTSTERRAKNNFQYRLKSKGWDLSYNVKGRIESASNYGLTVEFDDEEFIVSKGDKEVLRHPYGEGSLIALANAVTEHGEGAEKDQK